MKKKYFILASALIMVGAFSGVPAQNNLKDLPVFGWIINAALSSAATASNNATITVNEGQTATQTGTFSNLPEPINVSSSVGTISTATVVLNFGPPLSTELDEVNLTFSKDGLRAYLSIPGGFGKQDHYTVQRSSIGAPWGSVTNLGAAFNTSENDWMAQESPDGLTLYFDRNEGDLAKAVRPNLNTPWTDPSVVISSDEFVNINVLHSFDYAPAVSADGLTLIFQRNNINGLMLSTRANTSANWSSPTALSHINAGITTHPALSPDELTLYFTSDRPGGVGSFDVYKAVRADTSVAWTSNTISVVPVTEANTVYPDGGGFFALNTLSFSSARPGGFGNHDSYYLAKQWSWSLTRDDGPNDSQIVVINATDGNGGTSSETLNLIVNNVSPTASLTSGGAVNPGSTGSIWFSNQFDPSSADTIAGFRYAFDFDNDGTFEIGDGTYSGSITNASAVVPANFLSSTGTRTVRGRIIDKDGGFTDYTTTIIINPLTSTATVVQPASADYSPNDQSVTLTATVTANSVSVNAGTVQFTVKDGNGNLIGTGVSAPVLGGTASATYTIPGGISAQSLIITAEYSNGGVVYQISSGTNLLMIDKATPTITWTANQPDITYGTPLSATQLNATASVPGNFVYTPAAGTVLNAGNNQILSVNFTPNDTTNYNSAAATVSINVLKAALTIKADDKSRTYGEPPVSFTVTPTGLVNGDTLSGLDGTLAYNFADAANMPAGTYTISPSGLTSNNYDITFQNGTLTVDKAVLTVTADDKSRQYGAANPVLTGTITGIQNSEDITASYSTSATQISDAGDYPIVPLLSGATISNYEITSQNGTLTITKALQTIVWSNPADIVYGTPLGVAQLNAAVSVVGPAPHGTLSYTPAAGSVLNAGNGQSLTVNIIETNNYLPATASVVINVAKAPSSITASAPASVVNGGNVALSAVLRGVANAPLSGRSVTLSLGSGAGVQSCSETTDANGAASCTITGVNQPVGPNLPVSSNFTGDSNYLASSGSATTLVSDFPTSGTGAFVIGDGNLAVGQTVYFWGSQWARKNSLTGGSAPNSFKGFVNRTTTTPPNCGLTWTSDPGNSSNPPETIPAYIAVIVSSSITQTGSTILGNTPKIVIVKTNSGYGPNPGRAGTGTVVSVLCQ